MKYKTKTHVVDAYRVGMEDVPGWLLERVERKQAFIKEHADGKFYVAVCTELNGWVAARHGDYIVKNPYGQIEVMGPYVFENKYEPFE